nr:hypothetical protein [uncultured Roseateles sp.]
MLAAALPHTPSLTLSLSESSRQAWYRGLAMTAMGLAGFIAWTAWLPPAPDRVTVTAAPALEVQNPEVELQKAQRRLMMMESSHERLSALAAGVDTLRFSPRVAALARAEGEAGDRLLATQHALFLYQSTQLSRVDWAAKLAELEQQQAALRGRIAALRARPRTA